MFMYLISICGMRDPMRPGPINTMVRSPYNNMQTCTHWLWTGLFQVTILLILSGIMLSIDHESWNPRHWSRNCLYIPLITLLFPVTDVVIWWDYYSTVILILIGYDLSSFHVLIQIMLCGRVIEMNGPNVDGDMAYCISHTDQ